MTDEQLQKIIVGALRQTVDAHGPITKEWIGSAAKRIAHQIQAAHPKEDEPTA